MKTEIAGRDTIKKESIAYIGNHSFRKISYVQLYNYLVDTKKYVLLANNDEYKTDNINLLNVLSEISTFNRKDYDDISKKYSLQFANTQEKIDKVNEAIETERIRFKNTEYDILDSVYKEFEIEARIRKSEREARLSLTISKTSLGIALAALVISGFLTISGVLEDRASSYSSYETKIIGQNDSIIRLLSEQNKPDTTIVNIITPSILPDSVSE